MQEEIWDTPKRDRGLWGGDLHVTGETINTVFADRFLMEHSIFLSEYVLGIRPTSGGMKTVEIVPFLGDLRWASGGVPAPQGIIQVKAEKTADGQSLQIGLPTGVDALVGVSGTNVFVNGHPFSVSRRSDGISYVHLTKPGQYRLTHSAKSGNL